MFTKDYAITNKFIQTHVKARDRHFFNDFSFFFHLELKGFTWISNTRERNFLFVRARGERKANLTAQRNLEGERLYIRSSLKRTAEKKLYICLATRKLSNVGSMWPPFFLLYSCTCVCVDVYMSVLVKITASDTSPRKSRLWTACTAGVSEVFGSYRLFSCFPFFFVLTREAGYIFFASVNIVEAWISFFKEF